MRVVIDTNVIVSGLLSPYGTTAEIVRMIVAGSVDLLYDARIVSEYEEVLSRPKFSFDKASINCLIDFIMHFGIPVSATPLSVHLPDLNDEPFLEVAISGKAECLITGNVAHYPMRSRCKTHVLTPRPPLAPRHDRPLTPRHDRPSLITYLDCSWILPNRCRYHVRFATLRWKECLIHVTRLVTPIYEKKE